MVCQYYHDLHKIFFVKLIFADKRLHNVHVPGTRSPPSAAIGDETSCAPPGLMSARPPPGPRKPRPRSAPRARPSPGLRPGVPPACPPPGPRPPSPRRAPCARPSPGSRPGAPPARPLPGPMPVRRPATGHPVGVSTRPAVCQSSSIFSHPVNRPTDAVRGDGLTRTNPTEEEGKRYLSSLTLLADVWLKHGERGVTFQGTVLKISLKNNPL